MITIALIAFPALLGAALFLLGPRLARQLALGAALLNTVLTVIAVLLYSWGQHAQLAFNQDWVGPLGLTCAFQADGISLVMLLLSAIVSPLIIYASFHRTFHHPHLFYGLVLLMISAMNGAFTAADGLVFYIFYEVALIPIYFLILSWGQGDDRPRVTLKFFLYTLFGSLFMLVSLLYVYLHTTPRSFGFEALYLAGNSLSALEQGLVFAGIFIAFAVKMPVFPFHTWQPSTYQAAPTAGTMLLAAIMLKMATYGLVRLVIPMVPDGLAEYGHWALVLSVISIVYGSLMAINQKNYKLLIAYSSIAHVGLISAGLLSSTTEGIAGGLVEMVSHAILVVGLFFVYDILESRLKTDTMSSMGGIRDVNPTFAFLFFAIVMGSVALPFTSGFVGEYLLLQSLASNGWVYALFGGLTVILGAVYMLRAFQRMMLGPANPNTASFAPLNNHETAVLAIIVALVVVLGIYPSPVLDLANSGIETLLGTTR